MLDLSRLEQRAEAAEGWAVASKASVAELRAALAKEKEAHRRTKGESAYGKYQPPSRAAKYQVAGFQSALALP